MCLAIPAKVVKITPEGGGTVDYLGNKVKACFTLLADVKPGDWVIVHAGFAISRLDPKEARETLRLLREIAKTA